MKKEQKNSKKRLNSLILLVAFTAIMLIVSTYAWFSVQNDVLVKGITGTVESVEGMMVSLDGTNWTHELDLSTEENKDLIEANTNNLIPTELVPVSTTATSGNGIGATEVAFYRGEVGKSATLNREVELTNIVKVAASEEGLNADSATFPGYYALDLYVQNASDGEEEETLQLNVGSSVVVSGEESTGLQNTVRLALAEYTGSVDITATGTAVTGAEWGNISDVAIWEPNANAHVDWVVQKNNYVTYATESLTPGALTTTSQISTFALTADSVSQTIADIYNWNDVEDTGLALQNTVKTAGETTAVANLMSVDGTNQFKISPNKVVKLRVYLWLEGQDVDTINHASHGKGVTLNLGLTKGETI